MKRRVMTFDACEGADKGKKKQMRAELRDTLTVICADQD